MGFADFSGRNMDPNIYRWDDRYPRLEIIAHYFQFPTESVITYKCLQNHVRIWRKHVYLANYCLDKILPPLSDAVPRAHFDRPVYLTI